ncbi:MAG: hypothetical protein ACXVBX_15390 [Flavisolibacter sp.]
MDTNKENGNQKENTPAQPDKETLHKTDPQENMQGPVSSSIKQAGEAFDSDENKENADERREKRM